MLVLFGVMALFNDAADQSFLPQIVPRSMLVRANARLEQVSAVGETTGPAIAGGLVSWIGAPFVILANAFTYLFSGVMISTIKSAPAERHERSPVSHKIKEGLKWLYQHTYMKPLTLNTNFWFLWHSMTMTILVAYVISGLGFDESLLGIVLAAAGIGALIGTSLSGRAAKKFGLGRAISVSRLLYGPAVMLMVLAPGDPLLSSLILVMSGQLIYGFAMGIEGPIEMGFQQTVTPDHLLGRVNATKRLINRSMIVIGAPLGGAFADMIGFGPALWITITGLFICGIWFLLSPMDKAELEDAR